MCDHTLVQYKCTHVRFIVKTWCTKYQETHKRCRANVVAMYVRKEVHNVVMMTEYE
ncbi:hypothetical protein GQ44DRAFT_622112 [Phaeosphaeriaceae sp. PMI808]|nr:hypothetical protein GQ44DRAFT_622112 [Phaeosphaeriaceae sp. PMI808]